MAYEQQVSQLNALEAQMLNQLNQWNTAKSNLIQSATNAATSAALAATYAAGGGGGNPDPGGNTGTLSSPVYENGTFNATNYAATALKMGTADGVAYKHGPSPSYYGTSGVSLPTLFKNPDQSLDVISDQYSANSGIRNCRPCNLGYCGTWQVGGPPRPGEGGAYSSNIAQAAFIPDNPSATTHNGGIGVSDLTTWSCGENVASTRPELPWVYYGQGLDSINQVYYKGLGKDTTKPVCIGRGEGRPGWGISTLVAYRGGFIGVSGQNTGNNKSFVQLPANKVPVAITASNAHEFGFVAVWDTSANKGQIAVIAMAGVPDGVDPFSDPTTWQEWRGEWKGNFPGLPSYGNIGYMKIIGYLDLPSDMKCPTEVSASLFWPWENYSPFEGSFNMRNSATRARFRQGGDRAFAMPQSGVLAVASKEEKKVCFFDLAPLIQYYYTNYTNEPGIGTVGNGAGQWPPTFTEVASQMPTYIKTLTFTDYVTCMKLTRYATNRRCYVGTQDGILHIIDMGNYPAAPNAGNPASIIEVGTVTVGRNPTHIGLIKQHAGDPNGNYWGVKIYPGGDFTREVIVTSRGDRKIDWVRFNSGFTGGAIVRTLQDSRLVDPIITEDNDTHTTEHYEVTTVDYGGKQVVNYRYGPIIYWWNEGIMSDDPQNPISFDWTASLPPDGSPVTTTTYNSVIYNFECGGQFSLPGSPFGLTLANVY